MKEVTKMQKDIVCGMDVKEDTEYTTLHGAKKMFFCSHDCRQSFINEPDKYLGQGAETAQKKQKPRKAA